MHYTGAFPLIGVLLLVLDLLLRYKGRPLRRLGEAGYSILLAGWVVYVWAFISLDLTLLPVYETTSSGLPLLFRVASSWASGGGSLHLLAAALSIIALIHIRGEEDLRLRAGYASLVSAAIALAFVNGAFESFEGPAVTGIGLNPLLKSPWIYPHPLTTFTGYAMIVAGAMVLLVGRRTASELLLRMGWVFLTLGIAIGGYWSYVTFGWGGYWAWDPVETAELVPWLILTAFFHIAPINRRLARFSAYLSGASVFLAILVTRAGLSPLHGFASPQAATVSIAMVGILFFIYHALKELAASSLSGLMDLSSPVRFGLSLSFLSLLGLFLIAFSVLFHAVLWAAMGVPVEIPQMDSGIRFFHPTMFPLALLVIASVPLCTVGARYGWRESLTLVIGAGAVAVVLLVLSIRGELVWSPLSEPVTNHMISVMVPLASVALFSGLVSGLLYLKERVLVQTSLSLLHGFLALTMLGIVLSGPFSYSRGYFADVSLGLGESAELGGLTIRLVDYDYSLYGGEIDVYTPYAGKTENYKLSSVVMMQMFTGLGEALRLAERGGKRLREAGLLDLYEEFSDWTGVAGSFIARADGTIVNSTNITQSLGLVKDVGFAMINPDVRVLVEREDNLTVLRLLLVGKVSLTEGVSGLVPNERIALNLTFDPPILVDLVDWKLEVKRAGLLFFDMRSHAPSKNRVESGSIIVERGTLVVEEGRLLNGVEAPLPARFEGDEVALYVAFREMELSKDLAEIAEETGLIRLITDEERSKRVLNVVMDPECFELVHQAGAPAEECLGYLPMPKHLPEGAKLVLRFEISNGESSQFRDIELRFDANGEVQGIHGLVAQVIPVARGLHDVYVVINPPVVRGRDWSLGFHELMIYYVSEVFEGLPEEERLAVATLFTVSYLMDSVEDHRMLLPYTLDLYDLASGFDEANSTIRSQGVHVMVKVIPYVYLLWAGVALMALTEVSLIALWLRERRRSGRAG